MKITTLCYIEHDGQYLMLHRIKKENDINEGNGLVLAVTPRMVNHPKNAAPRSQRGNRAHTHIIPFPRTHNFYK